jgi:DNA-binding CsgD family transcriptional regulator
MLTDMEARLRALLVVALASIVVGGVADLILDRPETWLSFHVVFETLLIAGALLLATTLWLGWWRAARSVAGLQARLEAQGAERDRWQVSARQALDGLARAIDDQFGRWGLTPAEREVALLVLKGYGHKQIAGQTGRSERTVRQHAGVVYEKAGLGGRAELAAFFLQDLMLPSPAREALRPSRQVPAIDRRESIGARDEGVPGAGPAAGPSREVSGRGILSRGRARG